jgi:hypothetical protein
MADDVLVTERIYVQTSDDGAQLVAVPGDRIKAEDAQRWNVGTDGTQAKPADMAEPAPKNAGKRPGARTREGGQTAESR